jgi:hypothetical protein
MNEKVQTNWLVVLSFATIPLNKILSYDKTLALLKKEL